MVLIEAAAIKRVRRPMGFPGVAAKDNRLDQCEFASEVP